MRLKISENHLAHPIIIFLLVCPKIDLVYLKRAFFISIRHRISLMARLSHEAKNDLKFGTHTLRRIESWYPGKDCISADYIYSLCYIGIETSHTPSLLYRH